MTDGDAVRNLIYRLENSLFRPEVRRSKEEMAKWLDDDFIEFTGGGIFDKQAIIDAVTAEEERRITMTDFKAALLADHIVLATYRAIITDKGGGASRESLRSSIWKLSDEGWKIVFHQGTPMA